MSKKLRSFFILFLLLILNTPPVQVSNARETTSLTILNPGEGSEVTSPIHLSAEIQPNPGGLIRVALVNREGQEISRKLLRMDTEKSISGATFTTDLPFEIPTDQAKALLTLSILDNAYQTTALRSVEVILRSEGSVTTINQTNPEPWLKIDNPQPSVFASGGVLVIEGSVTPKGESPVIFELITTEKRVVGSAQLAITTPNQRVPFEIPLKYTIHELQTDANLIIRQTDQIYGVMIALDIIPLTLFP
ncbi:MAG: hypothetical protein ACOX7C_04475 [Brevefilum sp.]|jgi:hypothetical protein